MVDIAGIKPAPRSAWGREVSATLLLAWPLILTNLTQVAFGLTDVIMMGWLGPESLAAGALATNLNFALVIFGIGVVTATSPIIASELGRNRHSVREVRRTVRQGTWAAIVVSVPILLILWHSEPILLALGQEPRLAAEAAAYNRTLMWSAPCFLGYIGLRNFVSALQRPMAVLGVGIIAVALNALVVWALMFGHFGLPALGLRGAGIGTTITTAFLFIGVALTIRLDRRFHRYRLLGRFWRPDWPRFREIWRLGLPIALTLCFEVTVFNAAAFLMGLISPESIAAYAIAIQIASFAFMVPLGLGMAATVRVGRAYGARDWDAAARAGAAAWWLALGYACCTILIMTLGRRELVGLFLPLEDAATQPVIELAMSFVAFAGLFQFFDCSQGAAAGMLRGLQDTRVPMILTAVGYWGVGLPLSILLAFPLGLAGTGIWIGLAAGLAVVAGLLTYRWLKRERFGLVGDSVAVAS